MINYIFSGGIIKNTILDCDGGGGGGGGDGDDDNDGLSHSSIRCLLSREFSIFRVLL